jgi:hypothetical protein
MLAHLTELLKSFEQRLAGAAELVLCDDAQLPRRRAYWLIRHQGVEVWCR